MGNFLPKVNLMELVTSINKYSRGHESLPFYWPVYRKYELKKNFSNHTLNTKKK